MKAIIHVNRQMLAQNRNDGGQRPVYTIKSDGKTTYAHGVRVRGEIELVDPRETPPLSCGARAWINVIEGEVEFTEPMSFKEAKQHVASTA